MHIQMIRSQKNIALLLALIMMASLVMPVSVMADTTNETLPSGTVAFAIDQPGYTIDGQWQSSDAAPYMQDNRTMVPVRFAAEALGATVDWNGETKTVTVTKDSDVITIEIGSRNLTKNGQLFMEMDTVAVIVDPGRTMIPVSRLAEALGVPFDWDPVNRIAYFMPGTGEVTRTTEDDTSDTIFDAPGTYGPEEGTETIDGNVRVTAAGVILQNLTITGNLTITETVGDGDVTLNNITVAGDTFIQGGGINSIHINGGQYGKVYVQTTETGAVRIVAVDADGIEVVIAEDATGQKIILEGTFQQVTIDAKDVVFETKGDTNINRLEITEKAANATGTISEGTTINNARIDGENSQWEGATGAIKSASGSKSGNQDVDDPDSVIQRPQPTPAPTPSRDRDRDSSAPSTPAVTVGAINNVTINEGATATRTVVTTPTDATITAVSSNAGVATVAVSGKIITITGVSEGTATVTVTGTRAGYTNGTRTFTVTVTTPPPGTFPVTATINPSGGGEVTGTGNYYEGANVTLTAVPNTGFEFIDWNIGAETVTGSVYGFTMPAAAVHATANFSPTSIPVNYFTFDPETKTITGYDSAGGLDVIIPSAIDGIPVENIGENAFRNKLLTSVTIPNSVTSLGSLAFAQNKLTTLTIPTSVTSISESAFAYNELTSVNIPANVSTIGRYAFVNNNLTTLTIPNSVTHIGEGAFGYNNLTTLTIPNSVTSLGISAFAFNNLTTLTIPTSITSISQGAFSNNELTSVIIPANVSTIGRNAFENNKLTTLTIPTSITSISQGAFSRNELTSITIGAGVTLGDHLLEGSDPPNNRFRDAYIAGGAGTYTGTQTGSWINVVYFSHEETASIHGNFITITGYNTAGGLDVIIPSTINGLPVKHIQAEAFRSKGLTSVTIPDSVEDIGEFAFALNKLTTLTIPTSITTIEQYAFAANELTTLTIPTSITTIGQYAFYNNELTTLTIPDSVTIGNRAFEKNKLTTITIGSGVTLGDHLLEAAHPVHNNLFRDAYTAGGAGTYIGEQTGVWVKIP
ncbi:leucine-rich repeat protein [Anoxynatronum sibiricum]|uniref:Leucine-rich repeat protein n=1 Tax=Anoxynatronum sibiricum TaxID=210623 RepID=A0ABU9VRR6_9CLOT